MAGQYRRPRVTLGLDENIKEEIEKMARKEHRTLASLLEHFVIESYERRKNPTTQGLDTQSTLNPKTKKFLNGHDFIQILASGRRPTDAEITEVAHSEDIDPDVLIEIRDRKFPSTQHHKQPNGNPSPS